LDFVFLVHQIKLFDFIMNAQSWLRCGWGAFSKLWWWDLLF